MYKATYKKENNYSIFFKKWMFTGPMDAHLAKSLRTVRLTGQRKTRICASCLKFTAERGLFSLL